MELMETANRDYEVIKDKYFVIFVPAPAMGAEQIFESMDDAKRYMLDITHGKNAPLAQYVELEEGIKQSGGTLMILNVQEEVERYEAENSYGESFKDRQEFINVMIFGDAHRNEVTL